MSIDAGLRISSVLAVLLVLATAAWAQPVPNGDTLLLVQFDGTTDADFSRGTSAVHASAETTGRTGGRFGGGADLVGRGGITFVGNDGNVHAPSGTIDFWIKPHWPGSDPETHRMLNLRMGDEKYININSLGKGRLGIAVAAGEGDGWDWNRADVDVSKWQPDTWHHVAFVWGDGEIFAYADGVQGERTVADAPMPAAPPEEINLTACDAVIDAFRISGRAFTAEDVRRAIREADDPPYCYLGDLDWQPAGSAVAGNRALLGDCRVPLVLGKVHSAKSIGLRPSESVSVELSKPYDMLVGRVGVSALSRPETSLEFEILGNGKSLFQSSPQVAGGSPLEIRVPLTGIKRLSLNVRSATPKSTEGIGVWHAAVVRAGSQAEPMLAGCEMAPAMLDMYRRQEAADDYRFKLPGKRPFFVARKYWEDEIDPDTPLAAQDVGHPIEAFATPGEYEPINLVVYAADELNDVAIQVGPLRSADAELPLDAFDVRIVLRRLMRDLYTLPPERSTVVSRFLLPYCKLDVPAGTFREYHVIVHVPENAVAGTYAGTIRVVPANSPPQELPVSFEVLPFRLAELREKAYGVYYRFPPLEADWDHVETELVDIRQHGCTTLKSDLGVRYALIDGRVTPQFDELMHGLKLLSRLGFHGPLPVSTGAEQAARLLDYDPVADYEDLAARQRFYAVVKKAMQELVSLQSVFPHFEFLPTHMDEVFGRERLDRYIRLTEAVRQVPSLRVYITMHNDPGRDVSEMMRRCDPFVDVRSYNGHAMDAWIRAGNSFDDLRRELNAAGDEAWIYHNIRGAFFPPEWTRLVNGYYLWDSPLRVHVPWMYYSYKGNPMDATDGPRLGGGDFAYAVPDPGAPTRMIPTRHWEAFREGVDDMRYLETLEALIAGHSDPQKTESARRWLAGLRQQVTPTTSELQPIEKESPVLVYLSGKLDGQRYRQLRRQAAEHIERLILVP